MQDKGVNVLHLFFIPDGDMVIEQVIKNNSSDMINYTGDMIICRQYSFYMGKIAELKY